MKRKKRGCATKVGMEKMKGNSLPLGGNILLDLLRMTTINTLILLRLLMLLRLLAVQEILLAMNFLINVPNKVRVLGLPSKDLRGLDSP